MERPAAKSAVSELAKALKDSDDYVRMFAALALGAIGPDAQPAVPALCEFLRDGPVHLKNHAAGALGRIGPAAKAAIPELIATLSDAVAGGEAAQALAEIGPAAVPALKAALTEGDERSRSNATAALERIEKPRRP